MWSTPGVVGITGGKLTTFRVTARQVLREAARQVRGLAPGAPTLLFPAPTGTAMRTQTRAAEDIRLAGTKYSLSKLRWAARHEQVVHLDDVMLRRSRLGLITPLGGRSLLSKIKPLCLAELGWSEARWSEEEKRYLDIWDTNHAPGQVG
jgi:glycerol-3-phosphate dehydrogenase